MEENFFRKKLDFDKFSRPWHSKKSSAECLDLEFFPITYFQNLKKNSKILFWIKIWFLEIFSFQKIRLWIYSILKHSKSYANQREILYRLPAVTVSASTNCSFHEDVPIKIEAFALWTNLSTVFYGLKEEKERKSLIASKYLCWKALQKNICRWSKNKSAFFRIHGIFSHCQNWITFTFNLAFGMLSGRWKQHLKFI